MVVMSNSLNQEFALPKSQDAKEKGRVSFMQALQDKYIEQEEFDDLYRLPKDSSISTEITFVGFKGVSSIQKQLRRLASIDLSGREIKEAGDVDSIRECLNRVTILNLADNHLSWNEIITILCCLPNLKEIILTANNLEDCANITYPEKLCKRLNSIVLGRVGLEWETTIRILRKIWSSIDHVDLWNSRLTNDAMALLDTSPNPFLTQVKSLSLGQNRFTNLEWLSSAVQPSHLLELDVSRCMLKTLGIGTQNAKQLESLKVFNISYNDIESWKEIAQLNLLKSLTSLICNDNPFFITDKFARSQTVAHIGGLTCLNRETVTTAFRRDSEIMYLKKAFPDYEIYRMDENDQFKLWHPRYEELVQTYGLLGGVSVKQRLIGDKFVTVELDFEGKKISKKVPRDMRVTNLKMLCKGLFKLKSLNGLEIVCCEASNGISYPLDQDAQTLHFFSVENGHRLSINLPGS